MSTAQRGSEFGENEVGNGLVDGSSLKRLSWSPSVKNDA